MVLAKAVTPDAQVVPCRVASKCVTSTALDALDCDCAAQNAYALSYINRAGIGIFVYLDQEGRGNGLAVKILAMNGKAAGRDTFSAVEELGLAADVRKYEDVPKIIDAMGVRSISLLTNNPDKAAAIINLGVHVESIVPCRAERPPAGAARHLEAKRLRGHTI